MKRLLQGLFVFFGAIVVYLLSVGLLPGISAPVQALPRRRSQPQDGDDDHHENVEFSVDGTTVRAWFYAPSNTPTTVPCMVMAHGLAGVKAMGLDRYARRFQDVGFAVLVFDYRFWGESDGEPRHLAWIPHQLADWSAAVKYARSRPEVDAQRIALWGTSLSGGHVLTIAAADATIAAVIAQCPALDGTEATEEMVQRQGLGAINWGLILHAQRDLVRSWLGLSPHKVPIVGPVGSVALMPLQEAVDAFAELAPSDFVNEACARIAVRMDKYRPVLQADKVRCPVLLQICEHDPVTPPSIVEDANRRLGPRAEIVRYPIGHFDIYQGMNFEQAVAAQVKFLSRLIQ